MGEAHKSAIESIYSDENSTSDEKLNKLYKRLSNKIGKETNQLDNDILDRFSDDLIAESATTIINNYKLNDDDDDDQYIDDIDSFTDNDEDSI